MIALPLCSLEVGGREEGIDFSLFQISGRCLRVFLERYKADFFAPSDVLGAVQGHEAGQRVEGARKPLRGDSCADLELPELAAGS